MATATATTTTTNHMVGSCEVGYRLPSPVSPCEVGSPSPQRQGSRGVGFSYLEEDHCQDLGHEWIGKDLGNCWFMFISQSHRRREVATWTSKEKSSTISGGRPAHPISGRRGRGDGFTVISYMIGSGGRDPSCLKIRCIREFLAATRPRRAEEF